MINTIYENFTSEHVEGGEKLNEKIQSRNIKLLKNHLPEH